MRAEPPEAEVPLFPLGAVLFPGGLLGLTVFEARYLDLITSCLRQRRPFGVVALRSGTEVRRGSSDPVSFEHVGTLAELISADSEQPGILLVRCRGTQRFEVEASRLQADGLLLARTRPIDDDEVLAPAEALLETVRALASTIATLKNAKNESPFLQPYRLDDAGWVANRWCEILPISKAAKQKLMELPDPMVRLELVDEFLRSKGVIK
ncbi:MAG: LON peptidase substrate-binding domain-containing protein [Rhizobiales bacterium]|nr:LON peptidase substrate-binding domain-containing protein [Rhizobacter sp.]